MSFLLDTDICSAYLRNHPLVSNRFVQYGGQLHTTIITFAELQVWAKRKKASAKLLQSVLDMRQVVYVLPIDDSIAEKFGDIRAGRLDVGLHAPPMDMLNAATALVHGFTMVTHNVADYANVPGLAVVDWLIP